MATAVKRPTSVEVPLDESPFSDPKVLLADDLPPRPKSVKDTDLIIKALQQGYASIGLMISVVSLPDGQTVVSNAVELSESWRDLLDNDPKIRRIMKGLIQGGGWASVITAHMMVAIPIFNNHRDSFTHLIKRNNDADTD